MKNVITILIFWLFIQEVLSEPVDFESSNLPIVVINTHGKTIPDAYRIMADMGIIFNGSGQRNHVNDPFNDYNGKISIELRGSSSQMFPKKQYALETEYADGQNRNVALLGLPEENDWILNGPYSDKSLIRNVLIYRLARDLGRYASRTRFCELVLNGDYRGVYVLMEKIKRDKHRVNIAKLKPDEISGDDLTGGYIVKIDKLAGEHVDGWYSVFPPYPEAKHRIYFQYHYPKPDKIAEAQKTYIRNFIFDFEKTLFGPNYQDPQKGYYSKVDLNSFVDYFILNEISKNVDGYRLSAFFYKDKDSNDPRLHAGPIWDFNIAFGNADYYHAFSVKGWQADINYDTQFMEWDDAFLVPFWWQKFTADSVFMKRVIDRWQNLRRSVLATDRLLSLIDSYADTLEEAQKRNFERWPVLGTHVWPNYYVGKTYDEEIDYLKSWLAQRLEWMDSQLLDTQPPQPPAHLRATEITSYSVLLSWNAASDNVGIAGYDVFYGAKRIATTTKLSVTIPDLKDNASYCFVVKARDFAGNYSLDNPQIKITTKPFGDDEGIYCFAAPQPIKTDGVAESSWGKASWNNIGHLIQGYVENASDFSGKFKVLWDHSNLYLLVRVYDDVDVRDSGSDYYQDDDLEVYLDMDNSKHNDYDEDDFRYRFTYRDSVIAEKAHAATEGVRSATKFLTDGYQIEVCFPWSTLKSSANAEKVIGFEVQINDDDNGGNRDAKLAWWGTNDIAWSNPSAFGAIKLKEKPTGIKPNPPLATNFYLLQNRPNPFNSSTQIVFELKSRAKVSLDVFDLEGKKVCTLLDGVQSAGSHSVRLDASKWASGLYFYRLHIYGEDRFYVRRMLLLK